ncbi:MAG: ATP synthase F1 subunit gamma [Planctomycetota bacterium]
MSAQSVRFLKRKIRAVQNIKKIARAMQLVSAAKWKRFNDRLTHFLYFFKEYKNIVEHLYSYEKYTDYVKSFLQSATDRELIVILSSEKGLCGSYNSNIFRHFLKLTQNKQNFYCFPVGKKAIEFCTRNSYPVKFSCAQFLGDISFKNLTSILQKVVQTYLEEKMTITVIYTHFVNTMVYKVMTDTFLPLQLEKKEVDEKLWLYEPRHEMILDEIFDNFLTYKFLYYFYESLTSEHASRMIAMKNATENAEDLLLDLTIIYNKARQTMITKELLDIVGTAEAVK